MLVTALVLLSGCASTPPSGWQQGGATLVIPRARWVYGDISLEVAQNGRVIVSGDHWLTIDRAGRAFDPDNEPVALLRQDGMLVGPDDRRLGWVGAGETIRPGQGRRWITFRPNGEVLKFDGDQQRPYGVWFGCNQVPYTLQACALLTHLMAQSWWRFQPSGQRRSLGTSFGPSLITPFP